MKSIDKYISDSFIPPHTSQFLMPNNIKDQLQKYSLNEMIIIYIVRQQLRENQQPENPWSKAIF